MGTEIERKFLVDGDYFPIGDATLVREIHQGYMEVQRVRGLLPSVRIRLINQIKPVRLPIPTHSARMSIKHGIGLVRAEYEYEIPYIDGLDLIRDVCVCEIKKVRHVIPIAGLLWEVDVFDDGLVMAEVELVHPDQAVTVPNWCGREVTEDQAYTNHSLSTPIIK